MAEAGLSAALVMEVPLTVYAILSLLSLSAQEDHVHRELTILLLGEARHVCQQLPWDLSHPTQPLISRRLPGCVLDPPHGVEGEQP